MIDQVTCHTQAARVKSLVDLMRKTQVNT